MTEANTPPVEDGTDIVFLSVSDVVGLHLENILRFSPQEPQGMRDAGLLESAVLAPQQTWAGTYLYPTLEDMVTAYLIGLALNHAFEQGSKRVAFAACSEFLLRNGYRLTLTQKQAVDLTLGVVNGEIERDEVADVIANNSTLLI